MSFVVRNPFLSGALLATVVLIADQVSKQWMIEYLLDPRPIQVVVNSFLNLTPVWNRGVSFGLFQAGSKWGSFALFTMSAVITVCLCCWMTKVKNQLIGCGIGLVIGGAIGNMVDRYRFHAVFDFLDVHIKGYHWPAFNVADAAITIGVIILVIDAILIRSHEKDLQDQQEQNTEVKIKE